jgi:hypothetical protein
MVNETKAQKQYHSIAEGPKYQAEATSTPQTHIYMTVSFPVLPQALVLCSQIHYSFIF